MYDLSHVCFGYLNNQQQIGNQLVADKCKQLTVLHQNRLIPSAPKFESKSHDDLIRWAFTTGKRFLYIQSFGMLTPDKSAIQDCINICINDNTLVIGMLGYTGLDDCVAFIDLHSWMLFSYDSWSEVNEILKVETASQFDQPLRQIPIDTWNKLIYLNPIKNRDLLFDYFVLGQSSRTTDDTIEQFMKKVRRDNLCIQLIDNPQPLHNRPPGTKAFTEINKLVTVPQGFRALHILKERGFNPTTQVVWFSAKSHDLAFYRKMLEQWDGVDFPKFVREITRDYRFEFDTDDYDKMWQNALESFGGEREFKELWDAVALLRHSFVYAKVQSVAMTTLCYAIGQDPRTYINWGDSFGTNKLHITDDLYQISTNYKIFYQTLLGINPNITIEGLDYLNAPVCEQLKRTT